MNAVTYPAPTAHTVALDADGIAFPATARNHRILIDALKWARKQSDADRLGVDAQALERGDLIHLDRANARFDQYADDTNEDRFRRQFKGETRAQQLAARDFDLADFMPGMDQRSAFGMTWL